MKKEITGVFIDSINKTIEVKTIENTNERFYELLNCKSIECPTRLINGHTLIIVCDDEFLLKNKDLRLSGVCLDSSSGRIIERLYGNLFITKFDGRDDFKSLTKKEIEDVLDTIFTTKYSKEKLLCYFI